MATICLHHVNASMQGIRQRGFSEKLLLERAGINPTNLSFPEQRIHTDQVARLFALVQQQLDDEFMGFTPSPCRHGLFQLMCDLVRNCTTLGELLRQAVRFYSLVSPDITMSLESRQGRAIFTLVLHSPEYDPSYFLTEFLLVIWHRFPSWYIGESIQLIETRFSFAEPNHLSELQIMFPGKLNFSKSNNQLIFSAHYLDTPLVRSSFELDEYLSNAPADIMTIPGTPGTLDAQIERLVLQKNQHQLVFPAIETIARELGLSVQTLHRRLKQMGTHYQKIKDDLRRETAIRKLVKERFSVERVAEFVGYSESRSFTRAFKQWTGLSPRQYLKQH
ncbi:MAG: AraC-like DNA-binding protein [Parasphingorhabdus sp.]|jgi:AraC-like DNA-binding protein